MKDTILPLIVWLVSFPVSSFAQHQLYLDLRLGANYTFAEGAYFGKGTPPLKAYSQATFDEQAGVMLRWQLSEKFGIATGYSGSTLGWAYDIQVPQEHTLNPYHPERFGIGIGVYMHQVPVLLSKTIGEYNIREIDTVRHLYLASFRLDAVGGGGLNSIGNTCLSCNDYGGTFTNYDLIEFTATPVLRRKWGQFLIGGITARFYRLGKERLNLSLYYTQGLTDMLLVPVEYRYNTRRGATTLHVRGSGFSATLGVPLRLATFGRTQELLKSE